MKREMKISVSKLHEGKSRDDVPATPEDRLDLVEQLRLQAGKFLGNYPAPLRKDVITVAKMRGNPDA